MSPPGHVVRIIYEELVNILGTTREVALQKQRILLVGLYGQGKTTTAGKLAKFFQKKGLSAGLVGADVHRPAAYDQLKQLAEQINAPFYGDPGAKDAVKIAKAGVKALEGTDVIIVDSSGRHALEPDLIAEIEGVAKAVQADERLLVLDATVGQQAGPQAKAFHDAVGITGVIVTKLDGTAKGGGALSAVAEVKAPVVFIGVGEKIDDLEKFDPPRFISRLLGMGDLETLLERAQEAIDAQKAEALTKKIMAGKFTLHEMYEQIEMLTDMGPMRKLASLIPGVGGKMKDADMESTQARLRRFKIILESMADRQETDPKLVTATRADLLHDFRDVPMKCRRIKDVEHHADEIVHRVYEELNKTFITPIDREDIQALATELDNVLDMIEAASSRIGLYEIDRPTEAMVQLGNVIKDGTRLLKEAVGMIRNMKQANGVEGISIEVHRLENVADDLMNNAVAALFRQEDPVTIIKFKEITEVLEQATDHCEDVANVIIDTNVLGVNALPLSDAAFFHSMAIIMGGVVGAIAWDIITWLWGLPTSSSHALIGGLIGASALAAGPGSILLPSTTNMLLFLFVTGMAFVLGAASYFAYDVIIRRHRPTLGTTILAGLLTGLLPAVILGKILLKGLVQIVVYMVAAPLVGLIFAFGLALVVIRLFRRHTPTKRLSAVRWGVARRIFWAWIITIPASAGVGMAAYGALRLMFGV